VLIDRYNVLTEATVEAFRTVDGGQPPGSRGCFTPRRLPWISPLGKRGDLWATVATYRRPS
jgi:hypothetical protein